MKYLFLPVHLLQFWYIEGAAILIKSWKNLILLLEEDLALTLNWRLLFVGRVLSFIFRAARILIGVSAFLLATLAILATSIYWFGLPVFAFFGFLGDLSWVLLFSGIGLFFIHILTHPHKKVWQVLEKDLWQASWVTKKNLDYQKILYSPEVKNLLAYLETTPENFKDIGMGNVDPIAKLAFNLVKKSASDYIGPAFLFVAILKLNIQIEQRLMKLGLKVEDFEQTLIYLEHKKNLWRRVWIWDDDFAIHQDISDLIGSRVVVSEVVNILSQESKKNVLVVGPPGSGKSSLVKFLAKQIVMGDVPAALATKRLVELDLTKLLSGIKTQGDLAQKLRDFFEEVSFSGNIILVIDEIHNLGIGYSLMLPYLESDRFQFIATTESSNYTKIIKKNNAFARMFIKIDLPPATRDETLEILEKKAVKIEKAGKVKISFLALKAAVQYGVQVVHDQVLPDSAITLLEKAEAATFSGWVRAQTIKEVI